MTDSLTDDLKALGVDPSLALILRNDLLNTALTAELCDFKETLELLVEVGEVIERLSAPFALPARDAVWDAVMRHVDPVISTLAKTLSGCTQKEGQ